MHDSCDSCFVNSLSFVMDKNFLTTNVKHVMMSGVGRCPFVIKTQPGVEL